MAEGRTNTDTGEINKQDANDQNDQNISNNSNNSVDYFFSSSNITAHKKQSSEMTQKILNRFGNIFTDIGCFGGTFSLQLKPNNKPYQAAPRHVAYVLLKPFKEELECLQKMDIITPLGVDETLEWCNSFVVVPKANGKERLCLDPVPLNLALIRLVHWGPTLNDILPKLNDMQYMSIIDASSGYHNMQSSCLTMFSCPFGRYHYKCLPFVAVSAGNMFQKKSMTYLMTYQMYLELQMTSW